jgi:hypothetical protein
VISSLFAQIDLALVSENIILTTNASATSAVMVWNTTNTDKRATDAGTVRANFDRSLKRWGRSVAQTQGLITPGRELVR